MVKCDTADPYIKYYVEQAGKGINVYRGASYQKGHGVGSFFGSLFRTVMPLIRSGARAVRRQVLSSGASLLGDVAENKPFKQAFKERLSEASGSLKRKAEDKVMQMAGSGHKRAKKRRKVHSVSAVRRRKTSLRRKKTKKRVTRKRATKKGKLDIFS